MVVENRAEMFVVNHDVNPKTSRSCHLEKGSDENRSVPPGVHIETRRVTQAINLLSDVLEFLWFYYSVTLARSPSPALDLVWSSFKVLS